MSFYRDLHAMSEEQNKQIGMTTADNVNHLYGDQVLQSLQRKGGRFINACLMVTLSGGVVSDGLEDGRVVSGVGGQYNFVSMAHALQDGRLVMMLRSDRVKYGQAVSNIIWNYGHTTIPRILRDIVVTEYGIANLRSKSDKEIIAALLNIADSRFQAELLAARFKVYREAGCFPPCPFGNDFTEEALIPSRALKGSRRR